MLGLATASAATTWSRGSPTTTWRLGGSHVRVRALHTEQEWLADKGYVRDAIKGGTWGFLVFRLPKNPRKSQRLTLEASASMSTPPDAFSRSAGFTRGTFSNPALLYAAVGSVCGSEEGEMGPGGEELEMKGTVGAPVLVER